MEGALFCRSRRHAFVVDFLFVGRFVVGVNELMFVKLERIHLRGQVLLLFIYRGRSHLLVRSRFAIASNCRWLRLNENRDFGKLVTLRFADQAWSSFLFPVQPRLSSHIRFLFVNCYRRSLLNHHARWQNLP
jgi:hypothetical protein